MEYKGYLIDLDGTIYRGQQAIPGASEFIRFLNENKLPHLFITNNSSATPIDIAEKLNEMKIQAKPDSILTSSLATAKYIIRENPFAHVHFIGEKGLEHALRGAGCIFRDDQADYVVIGIDRNLTYEKLEIASLLIQAGSKFISTNNDPAIPKENGLLPGNGALTEALAIASNTKPIYIGKPEKIMMETALEMLELNKDEVLMIGDNYKTDILAGIQSNIDTMMVLTGYSTRASIATLEQPTYIYENLNDWLNVNKNIQRN